MALTDRYIKSAKLGLHADSGGLYLKVYATGRKSFVVRERVSGKDSIRTIGEYPMMTLAAARQRTADLRSLPNNYSVNQAFDNYYTHICKTYRRPDIVLDILNREIFPRIGKKPLAMLTRADCTALLKTITDRGSLVMANRTLAVVKKALDYCEQQGWVNANPMGIVKRGSIGGKEKPRTRNLSFDELVEFLKFLSSTDNNLSDGTRWALRMITLTGLRATESLNIASDGTVMTKEGNLLRVPLTPHVKALLRHRPAMPKDHRILSGALSRLKQTFTPHDLRRTFASRLSDLGVMPHVIEKMLDHKMLGMMAVYNRAEFWPERVAAQRLWGQKLAELRRKKPQTEPG